MSGRLLETVLELFRSLHAVVDALLCDVEGQFTHVSLAFPFLLHVLNELLALRSAALIEARVDGKLIGIDQLSHLHAEQKRLAVALGDAETAQQLGRYLTHFVVGCQQMTGRDAVDAVVVAQLLNPECPVVAAMTVPCVASPGFVPHPVAVDLKQTGAVGEAVGGVRPVPVGGLRVEMKPLAVVNAVHGLYGFLREGRRRPAPRLQIGQDMDVVDVYGSGCCQLAVGLSPRSSGLVCGEALARVLVHRVDVRVEWQRSFQHCGAIGVVVAQDDGRRVRSSRRLQTVFDAGDDGLGHPFDVCFESRHRLTEAHQEAHTWVFLHEGGNRLACVVGDERRDGAVAVLCLQSVMVGEGL